MRLNTLYNNKFAVSFEIFPPKTAEGEKNLWKELDILSSHKPDFVSVTYGAGGTTRVKTLEIALKVRDKYGIPPLVHFTCVGAGKNEIEAYLQEVKSHGIENILALRGDPPVGESRFTPHPDGFSHASELIDFIKSINGFTIAAAGYPEGHLEAPDLDTDIDNLKKKVDAGAQFIITQLFYNNDAFYDFMDSVEKKGIGVPIIPGIMPVTSLAQIQKITGLCGASVPDRLLGILKSCGSKDSICEAGLDYSIEQCHELKTWGVPGFHIYTINKSMAVTRIMDALGL
ncbi:MAG: methylenetetrahydrofolate reductase [NAD(P)H] [Spirochaetae bacterium HGW-Spirochaetae-1]|jgi:methylenetetrahydrofolate reductase (NADPH)|nr:MAG: methylenetetrahydrofolate reductase [NAD(P)H] [Spirochaetae bacterium HGW-Spirochaetae-1]